MNNFDKTCSAHSHAHESRITNQSALTAKEIVCVWVGVGVRLVGDEVQVLWS